MAVDKKISQLASGAPAQAGDEYVVARSGANYKLTLTNIAASMPPIGATTPNTGSFTSLTNSGNLTFSSTGQRITGDMSNATVSNRLIFQTSTVSGNTAVGATPNAAAGNSSFNAFNASDVNNSSFAGLGVTGSVDVRLQSGLLGTGTYLPMTFYTGGSERMRLDTSGNVGIGTASPNAKTTLVQGTQTYGFAIQANSSSQAGNIRFTDAGFTVEQALISSVNGGGLIFSTGSASAARMTIDSSGNVGIGGTANGTDRVAIRGTLPSSSGNSLAFINRAEVPSTSTGVYQGYTSLLYTQAASFTLTSAVHFQAQQVTIGSGSTVTNQYGFLVDSGMTGATNNYGFYSNIASGSNRWNFYAAGTAQNYFAGTTTVGNNDISPASSNVAGVAIGSSGYISVSRDSNAVAGFNRKTNDGDIVIFHQDGTTEGSISVSGNTISYNAFAGSHWSQLQDGSKPDILRGTVMESINELCVWPGEQNERLPKSKISDTAGSKKVYGVFMAWDNDWTATNDMLITSVGAFICRVNSSVTVQEGDLLESNGDGTARVQADDIIRSSTIGKVTSTVKTHQYADGSYCVPTVLYCG